MVTVSRVEHKPQSGQLLRDAKPSRIDGGYRVSQEVNVALALIESQGRWLVSRRASGRIFAGLWEFPGGKIETGETPARAAVREVREETSLEVDPVGELDPIVTEQAGQGVVLHLVRCQVRAGRPRANSPAIDEVRFATLGELADLPMPPANAAILARLTNLGAE